MNVRFQALGVAIAACILAACGEEQALGPTTQEFNKERQALVSKLEKGKGRGKDGGARPAPGGRGSGRSRPSTPPASSSSYPRSFASSPTTRSSRCC